MLWKWLKILEKTKERRNNHYSPTNVENKLFHIRDNDDYIILHTAIIENIDIFITGDKDFNDVNIDNFIKHTTTQPKTKVILF